MSATNSSSEAPRKAVIRFGTFEAELSSRELRRSGILIKLQDKPFQVLTALLARPNQLVTRDELRHQLWDTATYVDFDRGLNIAVGKLRAALCDDAEVPRYIETVPRRGYRFISEILSDGSEVTVNAPVPPTFRSRGRLWLSALTVAALVAAAATVYVLEHRPPASLNFHRMDTVLIARFENRTGESRFNGTVEAALGLELTNSQFVSIAPRVRIDDTLLLMRKPLNTPIDSALGREICLRDGQIRAMIAGRMEQFGPTYAISANLVDPATGSTVASFEEEASNETAILPAIHRLSDRLRHALGEDLSWIRQTDLALAKVTTPSLQALRLYSQADEQIVEDNQQTALELLKHAIAEDPNFASAYLLVAYALDNQDRPSSEYMPYAKRAMELSGNASESERYFIEASYYRWTKQPNRALPAYEALLGIDPAHFWGANNLAILYEEDGELQQAEANFARAAWDRPNSFDAQFNAAYEASRANDPHAARPFVDRAKELLAVMTDADRTRVAPRALWVQLYPAYQAWMEDDVVLASKELKEAEKHPITEDGVSELQDFASFHETLGQAREANAWLQNISGQWNRVDDLAVLQYDRGEHAALLDSLRTVARFKVCCFPSPISIMIQEGLLSDAKLAIKRKGLRGNWTDVLSGQLLLANHRLAQGIPELLKGLQRTGPSVPYFLGAQSLAQAYESEADLPAALRVLQDVSANRAGNSLIAVGNGPFWMRDQIELARLYRRLGRVQDAEKIENELRKLLAYADPDFPILLELNKLQDTSTIAQTSDRPSQ